MTSGDVVRVRFTDGRTAELVLDDHVLPDRTCGQYDEGYWAYDTATMGRAGEPDDPESYFVSSYTSTVYAFEPRDHAHTAAVGDVVNVPTPSEADA